METQKLLQEFERDGFALRESLLSAEQVETAQRAVEWAMHNGTDKYKWIAQYSYEWFREQPLFVELIEHPLVLEFAATVLGPDFHLIAAQCSRNTRDDPYAPGAMALHQDAVFFPMPERVQDGVPDYKYGFSAMWYVQDTPLEMGPTALVPGSHRNGRNYQVEPPSDAEVFNRAIPAGSLLLFSHRTWHSGRFNNTPQPRDLITNAYARRAVDKVQLTKPVEDGSARYIACDELLATGSGTLRQLLAA